MAKFVQLQAELATQGLTLVPGFKHMLLHHGTCRRDVYKAMYGQLVYGSGLVKPGTTLIYPEIVREVVRERFGEGETGVYDHQYKNKQDGRQVTVKEMAEAKWRSPPKTCAQCQPTPTALPRPTAKTRRFQPY